MVRNLISIDKNKQSIVNSLCRLAERTPVVKKVIVFGSAANRTCTADSDIDICYDVECDTKDIRIFNLSKETNRICDYNCDIIYYKLAGTNLRNEIDNKGVVVYES